MTLISKTLTDQKWCTLSSWGMASSHPLAHPDPSLPHPTVVFFFHTDEGLSPTSWCVLVSSTCFCWGLRPWFSSPPQPPTGQILQIPLQRQEESLLPLSWPEELWLSSCRDHFLPSWWFFHTYSFWNVNSIHNAHVFYYTQYGLFKNQYWTVMK